MHIIMDWLAFAGSILGGLIGGLFTYFGVRLTLKHEMEKEKKEQILKADAEKPRLEIVKFLNFEETKHNRNINNDCNVLMLDIKTFADDNGRTRFFYDEQALRYRKYSEFRENINIDTAIECFRNPYLW